MRDGSSYIYHPQLMIKLVRYQSNRTIIGKFIVAKTAISLNVTLETDRESNNTYQEIEDYISFDNTLGSRMKLTIYGDTSTSEYYTSFQIYYPITLGNSVRGIYEYYYLFSDYGDREEYCNSGATKFDIQIDGTVIQSLSAPFSNHHNKTYETDKYKITIKVVEK